MMEGWKLWAFMTVNSLGLVGCWGVLVHDSIEAPKRQCAAIAKHSKVEVIYDQDVGCLQRMPDGTVKRVERTSEVRGDGSFLAEARHG